MDVITETILIITGIINIVTSTVLLLGILISGRTTPTHIYLIYTAVLWILKQLVNPIFHEWLTSNLLVDYNVRDVMTSMFVFIIIGMVLVMYLLLLMDYFKWISTYKYIVIPVHFSVILSAMLLYHFVVISDFFYSTLVFAIFAILLLLFLLLLLTHSDIECLKRRKETDDESNLRQALILTYVCVRLVAVIVMLFESLFAMATRAYHPGAFATCFYHLDTVFNFIVMIKNDTIFKNKLIDLFSMCTYKVTRKIEFENLSNDNGRLLRQDSVAV